MNGRPFSPHARLPEERGSLRREADEERRERDGDDGDRRRAGSRGARRRCAWRSCAAPSSDVVENVRSGVPSSSSSSTRARTCGKKSRTRRVLTPISSQRRKRSSIFGRSPRSTARRTSSTLNSSRTRGKSASVPRYGTPLEVVVSPGWRGFSRMRPRSFSPHHGCSRMSFAIVAAPRRVAHEDDGPEVEAEGAHAPRDEADGHALGDEEDEVHAEEGEEERARDEIPPRAEDDEREGHGAEERRARDEGHLVLDGLRAAAAVGAAQEEEPRPDQDDRTHEDEVHVEVEKGRQTPGEQGGRSRSSGGTPRAASRG